MSSEIEYRALLKAVEKGSNKAKTKLAWYKLSGCGGAEIDEEGAVVLLEERVKENDAEAKWMLGVCCEFGRGIEQNTERSMKLYKESSEQGNRSGKYLVRSVRECGIGKGTFTLRYGL